uniref:Uncharacterized protein n=1 Tax=Cajanus cajan TaxID=3821 RepID=A0A151T480_CAJCA|nr:hypothetical protein KK1_016368 [Cajanus cajan]
MDKHFYAKFLTCEFWLEEVSFLGHVICCWSIVMDLSKVWVILRWETLSSISEIRSFLG